MAGRIERVRVPAVVADPCNGCHECALRCTAGVQMLRREFDEIIAYLRTLELELVQRVMEQSKEVQWFEEVFSEACLFLDLKTNNCLVYPARPLICRLFGAVEWLPCPAGKSVPQVKGGLGIIREYAKEPRRTFAQWQMETGLFDARTILAG